MLADVSELKAVELACRSGTDFCDGRLWIVVGSHLAMTSYGRGSETGFQESASGALFMAPLTH